ncbi:hypothetical protein AMS68_007923 [Peltaster fructicola]|uniref:Major facilitator superfamily (MFS) profile domain-containing protein n=1 Tax=Peltaster fructicola TaxID=286661 RepID=A0A6H0Y5Z7_9PEZI|nr:hypothetical protein AMS68_007923 [Peltaster fructicola]
MSAVVATSDVGATEAKTDPAPPTEEAPYSIFDKRQKSLIIVLITVAATFTGLASNIYFPAIPTVAKDLNVTPELINLSVTSYLVLQGLAPSLWGPLSDARGRRVAYCCIFVVFLGACIGLACLQNYATLVVLRCLQSAGSASGIAIGSGVLADITTRSERGGYMGIFQAGLLTPVAIGPVIGGALAGSLGWRSIFWFLTIYAGVYLIFLILLLPETLRSVVGNGSHKPSSWATRYPLELYQRTSALNTEHMPSTLAAKRSLDVVEPLRILISKQAAPIVVFMAIYYAVWQMSITAMSTLFATRYGLNESQIGLTFIANGIGSMIGTLASGKILDYDYRRVKTKHHSKCGNGDALVLSRIQTEVDFPLEQARLRLMPIFAGVQCLAILLFGWSIQYSEKVSIAAPIVSTFLSGLTAVSAQSVTMTYLIDSFPDRSAAASATVNLARCLCAAGGTSFIVPMINAVGVGLAFTICTIVQCLAFILVIVQWRYAGGWRQAADEKRLTSAERKLPS